MLEECAFLRSAEIFFIGNIYVLRTYGDGL